MLPAAHTDCSRMLHSIAHSLAGQQVKVWAAWLHHLPASSRPQPCLHLSERWTQCELLGLQLPSHSKAEAGWGLKRHI